MGSHGASASAGAALFQRKETMWAVSCAEIPWGFDPFLPKWGFPKWQSQSGVGSAAESQHMMTLDRKDSISVCTFSWYPGGSTSTSTHPNNFRESMRIHLSVLWANSPVIYQFFIKSWCLTWKSYPGSQAASTVEWGSNLACVLCTKTFIFRKCWKHFS